MTRCPHCATYARQSELSRLAFRDAALERDRWRRLAILATVIALVAVANAVWAVTR